MSRGSTTENAKHTKSLSAGGSAALGRCVRVITQMRELSACHRSADTVGGVAK